MSPRSRTINTEMMQIIWMYLSLLLISTSQAPPPPTTSSKDSGIFNNIASKIEKSRTWNTIKKVYEKGREWLFGEDGFITTFYHSSGDPAKNKHKCCTRCCRCRRHHQHHHQNNLNRVHYPHTPSRFSDTRRLPTNPRTGYNRYNNNNGYYYYIDNSNCDNSNDNGNDGSSGGVFNFEDSNSGSLPVPGPTSDNGPSIIVSAGTGGSQPDCCGVDCTGCGECINGCCEVLCCCFSLCDDEC